MRKTFRTVLVGVLVLSMTVDSATACRWLTRRVCCDDPCAPVCCDPCDSVCSAPCYLGAGGMFCPQPCGGCYADDGMQYESRPTVAPQPEMLLHELPSAPTPATVNMPPKPELPPAEIPEAMPGPAPAMVAPQAEQSDEWRPSEEPQPLTEEPSHEMVDVPLSDPTESVDNLFGTTPEVEMAPAATETEALPVEPEALPAEMAPAATPATEAPSDLFGPAPESSPSESSTPVETDDDLFGFGASEPAMNEQPGLPAADIPEAAAEAEAEEASDMFGSAPAETAPADLFEPATPDETETIDEGANDMFGIPDAPETENEPPADEEAPPADTEKEQVDDLFDAFGAVMREPGGLASDAMREWVDNTGGFTCRARMIQFQDGKVRLLKDNGRTATVPVFRLSQGDLEFVHRQASAQRADVFGHTADAGQR